MQYYYSLKGNAAGPVSDFQLRKLFLEEKITVEALICPVGSTEWHPLHLHWFEELRKPYEPPSLVGFFQFSACSSLLVGIFGGIYHGWELFLGGLTAFFFNIGLAQVIDCVARTAYHAERIDSQCEIFSALYLKALFSMQAVRAVSAISTPPAPSAEAQKPKLPSDKKYYYHLKEKVEGPEDASHLGDLLNEGLITMETLVCPVGSTEWRPLREFEELTPR